MTIDWTKLLNDFIGGLSSLFTVLLPLIIFLIKSGRDLTNVNKSIENLRSDNKEDHEKIWQALKSTLTSDDIKSSIMHRLQNYLVMINDPGVCDFIRMKTEIVADLVVEIATNMSVYSDKEYFDRHIEATANKVRREGIEMLKDYKKRKMTKADPSFIDKFYESHMKLTHTWQEEIYEIITDNFNSKVDRIKDSTVRFITKYSKLAHNLFYGNINV